VNNLSGLLFPDTAVVAEHLTPVNLAMMPRIFRLTSIYHAQLNDKRTLCTASLNHDKTAIKVSWMSNQPDLRLKTGDLVSPRWLGHTTSESGMIKISRLILMEHPEPWENLFCTVPHGWVKNRELVKQPCWLKLCPNHIDFCSMPSSGMERALSNFALFPHQ
jgi:3'-5' exoribonuclease